MRFEIDGIAYQITFEHGIYQKPRYEDHVDRHVRGYTEANLYEGPVGARVWREVALALCSLSDQFCKETGRKVALARLLDNLGWGRAQRRVAWQAYWQERGVQRG